MTTSQTKKAGLGRDYWQQYVNINGYSFSPNGKGLKELGRNLDLNVSHLRECINLYLEA